MKTLNKILFIFSLVLFVACSSDDGDNTPIDNNKTIEEVLTDIGFNGFAIVTKNGNDLVRQGFGLANEDTAMLHDLELPYRIGSVTKTLTSAAMFQLKRDGLISSFDQTLDQFDDEFPFGNQISIRQLLSHQSGIPDYFFVADEAYDQGVALEQDEVFEVILQLLADQGLNFTPGTSKEYSNSNFYLAGLLIEELSGMSYHEYVQQKILSPLGMNSTFEGDDVINAETHAEGYRNNATNSTYNMVNAFSAGDFSSSPKDMEIWINAVQNNWFTTAEKDELFAENVPSGFVDFGLGWFTTQEGNNTLYWHGGDIRGFWSMIGFIPNKNLTVILLSNHQDDTGLERNTFIQEILNNNFN